MNNYNNGGKINNLPQQSTCSYGARGTDNTNIQKWFWIGIAGFGSILTTIKVVHNICTDRQKRADKQKEEANRKQEKEMDRAYNECRQHEDRAYREAQKKESREYRRKEIEEQRMFYAQQREIERQARAEEREKNRQHRYEMKQLKVNAATQFNPAQSENMAEFSQREHCGLDELRLLGHVIHSGERGIVFGGTGQCKSFLVWQIGIDLALGQNSKLFPAEPTNRAPMPVYIIDGEMSDEDINDRYSKEILLTLSNLHRITKMSTGTINLINEIRTIVDGIQEPECTIIVDNLNSLCQQATPKQIGELYDALKTIGEQANERGTKITLIVVTHERKNNNRNQFRSMSINDIYGTSFVGDFAEFIIGIAPTQVEEIKRIQVVKSRKTKKRGEVILARLVEEPYKMFEYVREVQEEEVFAMDKEDIHSEPLKRGDISLEVAKMMKALYIPNKKGHGWNSIGKKFGVSGTSVKKAIDRYHL